MKKLLLILLFTTAIINAQKIEYNRPLKDIKKVKITSSAKIKIIAKDEGNLTISPLNKYHNHYENRNKEKKKGLKAIYPNGGEDATNGLGLSITEKDGIITIKDLKSHVTDVDLLIKLPKNINISMDTGLNGSAEIEGFSSEIEAETNVGELNLKNVTGPLTLNTNTGNINIAFSKVNQSSPITIVANIGEIDITLPSDTKANLDVETSATLYTNFDFKAEPKKGLKNVSGLKEVINKINGGGVQIKLKSFMGNIYLRKKE